MTIYSTDKYIEATQEIINITIYERYADVWYDGGHTARRRRGDTFNSLIDFSSKELAFIQEHNTDTQKVTFR